MVQNTLITNGKAVVSPEGHSEWLDYQGMGAMSDSSD